MLVHIQTITQSTFGWIDEEGNIKETRTISALVPRLVQSDFEKMLVDLYAAREQLRQEFQQEGSG